MLHVARQHADSWSCSAAIFRVEMHVIPVACDTDIHCYSFCCNALNGKWLHQRCHLHPVAIFDGMRHMLRRPMDRRVR